MTKYCQLWLTVGNRQESELIGNILLSKHLVACVREIPMESKFWWRGKIDISKEILLQMESRLDLFDKIEAEVSKTHRYDTFVLEATPLVKISKKAAEWLKSELV